MAGALDPSLLDQPVTALPGAGPVTAARLAERGLESVRDLLGFLPLGYQDFRTLYPLSALAGLPEGQTVVVRAVVRRVRPFFRRLLDVYLEQDGVQVRARWFRPNAGMVKTYAKGNLVALAGCLRRAKDGAVELIHPRNVTAIMDGLGAQSGLGLRPRYPAVEKISGRVIEKLIAAAVEQAAGLVPDVLPAGVAQRFDFPSIADSLRQVHQPEVSLSGEKLAELVAGQAAAQRRLAFEDLFVVQVGLARERSRAHRAAGWRCEVDGGTVLASARSALPFVLTCSQERAIQTIYSDLGSASPMQRLLQGDVGSGKTAVAFAAALLVGRAGGQSLLMAPTEVLAEQHGRTLAGWGGKAGLRVEVLHAGLAAQERRRVFASVASGDIDLLVGTHALLEESLRVRRLALAIVDEQHRFGVRQRAALRRAGGWIPDEKTGMVPHLLVLSATPIPRSLALTAYGDLELTTLDESPPGRRVVATNLGVGQAARREAWAAVKAAVAAGGQGFVVCPAIVEQKPGRRASVLSRFRELGPLLAPARVGLLHGQMPSAEQQKVVAAFRAGKIDVLVATTVLEVGVDVPRASIIVIEDAERFGLAQLHQLRGRVGRAGQVSSCFLLTSAQDAEILDRLAFVAATSDGFRIAEEDLRRRGPGEIYGERQTGVVGLWLRDPAGVAALVERARQEAEALLAEDPTLSLPAHAALRQAVETRWLRRRPIAEEAG